MEKQQPRRTLVDRRIFAYESANFRLNTEANETIPVLRAAGKPRRAAFFLGGWNHGNHHHNGRLYDDYVYAGESRNVPAGRCAIRCWPIYHRYGRCLRL